MIYQGVVTNNGLDLSMCEGRAAVNALYIRVQILKPWTHTCRACNGPQNKLKQGGTGNSACDLVFGSPVLGPAKD